MADASGDEQGKKKYFYFDPYDSDADDELPIEPYKNISPEEWQKYLNEEDTDMDFLKNIDPEILRKFIHDQIDEMTLGIIFAAHKQASIEAAYVEDSSEGETTPERTGTPTPEGDQPAERDQPINREVSLERGDPPEEDIFGNDILMPTTCTCPNCDRVLALQR